MHVFYLCFFFVKVKQLARLSLVDPQYVSVHEEAKAPTPAKLEQVQLFSGAPPKMLK